MTEAAAPGAGALLRAARERQGLHLAALAAAIKVSPRKLDALENDRWDELPDATFTRALAKTVCRQLKLDPQAVLALLPQVNAHVLDDMAGTMSGPLRGAGSAEEGGASAFVNAIGPMVWVAVALLVAAVAVWLSPTDLFDRLRSTEAPAARAPADEAPPAEAPAPLASEAAGESAGPAAAPPASGAVAAAGASVPAAAAPALLPAPAASAASAPAVVDFPTEAPPGLVQVVAAGETWIEARGADEKVLYQRLVAPGEAVGFTPALPFKLIVGKPEHTRVMFRGQPLDLQPSPRDGVARLTLR